MHALSCVSKEYPLKWVLRERSHFHTQSCSKILFVFGCVYLKSKWHLIMNNEQTFVACTKETFTSYSHAAGIHMNLNRKQMRWFTDIDSIEKREKKTHRIEKKMKFPNLNWKEERKRKKNMKLTRQFSELKSWLIHNKRKALENLYTKFENKWLNKERGFLHWWPISNECYNQSQTWTNRKAFNAQIDFQMVWLNLMGNPRYIFFYDFSFGSNTLSLFVSLFLTF